MTGLASGPPMSSLREGTDRNGPLGEGLWMAGPAVDDEAPDDGRRGGGSGWLWMTWSRPTMGWVDDRPVE